MPRDITPDKALHDAARLAVALAHGGEHHIAIAGIVAQVRADYPRHAAWEVAEEIRLNPGQIPAATREHLAARAKMIGTIREVSRFLFRHHRFMAWAIARLIKGKPIDDDASREVFERMRR